MDLESKYNYVGSLIKKYELNNKQLLDKNTVYILHLTGGYGNNKDKYNCIKKYLEYWY